MLMDLNEIKKLEEQGFLKSSTLGDLSVYCYTDKCVWNKEWNEHTRSLRGTVLNNKTGKVISHPFPKFFNINEMPETLYQNLPDEEPVLTHKMDGSLLNISVHEGELLFTTKCSFDNIYTDWAKNFLTGQEELKRALPEGMTLVCEVVLPLDVDTMRRVVDHEPGITLLAIYDHFGTDLVEIVLPRASQIITELTNIKLVPREKQYSLKDIAKGDGFKVEGVEGWVAKYSNGLRVKFKTIWYLQLFRWINSLEEKHIKEFLIGNDLGLDWLDAVPLELREEVEALVKSIMIRYDSEIIRLEKTFEACKKASGIEDTSDRASRKAFAALATKDERPWALFAMLDNNLSYREKVMEQV